MHTCLSVIASTLFAGSLLACSEATTGPGAVEDQGFQIADAHYNLKKLTQFKLPKALREISGLALDGDDRLFAHGDELGIIYQLDYSRGAVVGRFALQGLVKADFEGIAVARDRLFLITSTGTLYETHIGRDGDQVPFERHRTDVNCEVEGLTYLAVEGALLIACKNLPKKDKKVAIRIYRWFLDTASLDSSATLSVSRRDLAPLYEKRVQPTAITVAGNGNLLLVAGRQHLLLELTTSGQPVAVAKLPESRHARAEGVALTADGRLIVADEGDGRGKIKSRGRLSVYHPAR